MELMTRMQVLQQRLNLSAPDGKTRQVFSRLQAARERDQCCKLICCVQVSDAYVADSRHLVEVSARGNSIRDFWTDRGYRGIPRESWPQLIDWRPNIQRRSTH